MIHRGKIFDSLVRGSRYSITEVAAKLGITQRHFYNLIQQEALGLEWFIKLSKVTGVDYSNKIPELKNIDLSSVNDDGGGLSIDYTTCVKEREILRQEKITLLQQNNAILERYVALLEGKNTEYYNLIQGGK